MDETFAQALRSGLVDQVNNSRRQSRWWARPRSRIAAAGSLVMLALTGGGIAYATGAWTTPPGGQITTVLAAPVTHTGVGTQTVRLGKRPPGATTISIAFTCLSAGDFTFADGASVQCSRRDASGHPSTATYSLSIAPGQDSTTITATPGARWHLVATYASQTTTAWGVNADGQTYGVQNAHGVPDLIAVIATNHRLGYVYAKQLNSPAPKSPAQALAQNNAPARTLTVYKSDGKTPIGKFILGQ